MTGSADITVTVPKQLQQSLTTRQQQKRAFKTTNCEKWDKDVATTMAECAKLRHMPHEHIRSIRLIEHNETGTLKITIKMETRL